MRKEQEAQDKAQREAEYKKEEARKRRLARYACRYRCGSVASHSACSFLFRPPFDGRTPFTRCSGVIMHTYMHGPQGGDGHGEPPHRQAALPDLLHHG